jgi:hypothetical protein
MVDKNEKSGGNPLGTLNRTVRVRQTGAPTTERPQSAARQQSTSSFGQLLDYQQVPNFDRQPIYGVPSNKSSQLISPSGSSEVRVRVHNAPRKDVSRLNNEELYIWTIDDDYELSALNDGLVSRQSDLGYLEEFLHTPLNQSRGLKTVSDLLQIDMELLHADFNSIYTDDVDTNLQSHQINVSYDDYDDGMYGGQPLEGYETLVANLYKYDVKLAKYDQIIAYRTYQLYAERVSELQAGGGIRDTLNSIHNTYKGMSVSDKLNGLQSLSKALLVYLFKKVMSKMKVPEAIVNISLVDNAEDFFSEVIDHLRSKYSPATILVSKLRILKDHQFSDQEKKRKLMLLNISIIEGISTFANLIRLLASNESGAYESFADSLDDLDFLITNLQDMKTTMQSQYSERALDFSAALKNFIKNLNPKLHNASSLSHHKQHMQEMNRLQYAAQATLTLRDRLDKEKNPLLVQSLTEDIRRFEAQLRDSNMLDEVEQQINQAADTSKSIMISICTKIFTSANIDSLRSFFGSTLERESEQYLNRINNNTFIRRTISIVETTTKQIVSTASKPFIQHVSEQVTHILRLLAPFAMSFSHLLSLPFPILTVINLSIVALHYLVRTTIFFWKRYAKKNNEFDIHAFVGELKSRQEQYSGKYGGRLQKTQRLKPKRGKMNNKKRGGTGLPAIHSRTTLPPIIKTTTIPNVIAETSKGCLLYTSDAADE